MDEDLLAGRYRRVRPLGAGGMGDVWLAEDVDLGRKVAVKRLRFDAPSGQDAELVERMLREARVVARLKHPAIVTLYDLVRVDGRPHLILEYVDGESLADRLTRDRTADWRSVARVIADTAGGLAAAHQAGVLHRDVKPGNVLVDLDGRGHLADFGIARGAEDVAITRAGEMVGTLAYLPPEGARQEPISAASDVWSLGATFFAAVEGHPPFVSGGADVPAIIARIVREDAPTPQRAGACTAVVTRMLATDPSLRPTAAEVVSEIERALSGPESFEATGPMPTSGPSPVTEEVQAAPPGPSPVHDSHDAPTLYGGPARPPTPSTPTQWGAPVPEQQRRGRGGRIAAVLLVAVLLVGAVVGVVLLQGGDDDDPAAEDTSEPTDTGDGSEEPVDEPVGFTEPVDVGPSPGVPQLAPDGRGPIYVSSTGSDTVFVVDRETGESNPIPVCGSPGSGIAVAPGGQIAYVPCGGPEVWVISPDGVEAMIPVNGAPFLLRVSADGSTVYAPQRDLPEGGGQVAIIDTEAREVVDVVPFVGEPGQVQLAPDGSAGYSPDHDAGAVMRIDADRSWTSIPMAAAPNGLQVGEDGSQVFVTLDDDRVQMIDRGSDGDVAGEVVDAPGASQGKIRVQPGTDRGFIPDLVSQNVQVVGLTTGDSLGSAAINGRPAIFVYFTPDGSAAYVVLPDVGGVDRIDTEDLGVTPLDGVGDSPRSINIAPDGSVLYVVGHAGGNPERGTLTPVPLG